MSRIVIVGNGPVGHRLADRTARGGEHHRVTVLGAERCPAYNRVLLPSVVAGTLSGDDTRLPPPGPAVVVRVGERVTDVDRDRRRVRSSSGAIHHYDVLVLATGARPVWPEAPGLTGPSDQPGAAVVALRTLDDVEYLGRRLRTGLPVTVLGGGTLGLETARALAARGARVDLVHRSRSLMERQLDDVAGAVLLASTRALGITVHLGHQPVGYRDGHLVLDDGREIHSELVVVAVGASPRTELATGAGLVVRRGVVVDDTLTTSDPHIRAVGDCAEHDGVQYGLLAPGFDQADVLASLLTRAAPVAAYRGSSAVTRLKARDIDLTALGDSRASEPADLVTMADQRRGRYARLAVRDDRVTGAILIGFPRAAATLGQLYDRGDPLPDDPFHLLLGETTGGAQGQELAELPDTAVVCRCNAVSKRALVTAWRVGARDVPALSRVTRAGTGCGGCAATLTGLCRWLERAGPAAAPAGAAEGENGGAAAEPEPAGTARAPGQPESRDQDVPSCQVPLAAAPAARRPPPASGAGDLVRAGAAPPASTARPDLDEEGVA
ncbi:NAD(P)/FAD-dependent oxidoreductase [Actinoalloteichus sp. AHMU CJ021]|uniref:Assimilatory nitrate reductase electron transfer subunit n=2 Tax=Actinoalloteichus cyanogriseus TaxID=2893586 RepID=A0ABT1JNJ4_ACTCY|nr:FAD-dependent oxidoreductase [Actinoalloteichus caeruleus]AUS81839.1 NAD(P)/FAD-dependent oxidoreductase [Actinoalloteichus sp. AHMU CJ021]MCP2334095.1 assimilatory nitrate reductase electron transfer subunit [Actinoalloteichus caeruleus DSM 43889]